MSKFVRDTAREIQAILDRSIVFEVGFWMLVAFDFVGGAGYVATRLAS